MRVAGAVLVLLGITAAVAAARRFLLLFASPDADWLSASVYASPFVVPAVLGLGVGSALLLRRG
jgi:hypothetical protein